MLVSFFQGSRRAVLVRAAILISIIALIDWRVDLNISLGFLYLFPMLMVGSVLSRGQITLIAAVCAALEDLFDPFPWVAEASIPHNILVFAAFLGTGLFAFEMTRNRQQAQRHLTEIEEEAEQRHEAQEQLKALVESSPAAILTLDATGTVLLANAAAHQLLDFDPGTLSGAKIQSYLPALGNVPASGADSQSFRTVMQCNGRRRNGDVFLAEVWFSTYSTRSGPRLAAMVVDASDNLRDREELSLQQLMTGSRILVAAVSHEIRNICGAIAAVHTNLSRNELLAGADDFRTLGTLVEGLARIAGTELRLTAHSEISAINLLSVLDELRIIMDPSLRDSGITLRWEIPAHMPLVWAERQSLLQVFLNLAKNGERALRGASVKELTIQVTQSNNRVLIRFIDSGPGILDTSKLFQPFQRGAETTGLGLYLSRAFVRSFRGDLRCEQRTEGCSFVVELAAGTQRENEGSQAKIDANSSDSAAGRPYAVSGEPEPITGRRA